MSIELIPASARDRICALLDRMSERDIFYEPEYLDLFSRHLNEPWMYATYTSGDDLLMEPFFLRHIPHSDFKDLISPWYYGGPLFSTAEPERRIEMHRAFRGKFSAFCRSQGIISEFARFHPIFKNYAGIEDLEGHCVSGKIVIVDLEPPMEEIRAGYKYRTRKNLRKAGTDNIAVMGDIETFTRMYYRTMERKSADDFYYFEESFFKQLHAAFPDRMNVMAIRQDNGSGNSVGCTSITLGGGGSILHDFLRGSTESETIKNCAYLLVDHSIALGKQRGYTKFILGGGKNGNPDDTLFRFKRGFSKEHQDFHLLKAVHDRDAYRTICAMAGIDAPLFEYANYFPEYRST